MAPVKTILVVGLVTEDGAPTMTLALMPGWVSPARFTILPLKPAL